MSFSFSPHIITSGLVLYLDAANTRSYVSGSTVWNDLSRSGISSTLTNGPTFNNSNNGSIVFNGTNNYSLLTNPSSLTLQNLSISIWVRPNPVVDAVKTLIDFDHSTLTYQGWTFQSEDASSNRYYYFAYYDGSSFQPVSNIGAGKGVQLINSTWQNLTYTKNGTAIVGYLNGVSVFNANATNSTISYISNRNLTVGGIVNTSFTTRYFNGNISNVLIYNRALTASEVLQNYNATKSRFNL